MIEFVVAITVGVLVASAFALGDRAQSRNVQAVHFVLCLSIFGLGQCALGGALAALYFLPEGMHPMVAIGAGIIVVSSATWNALAWLWKGTPRARRRCGK